MQMKEYEELIHECMNCEKCGLSTTRTASVLGVGSLITNLIFIGEGPGEEEDRTGIPFVGRAGQMLTRMLGAIDIPRNDIYLTNIVRCRPPNNRTPHKEEIESCFPYLLRLLDIIQPRILCTVGAPATSTILGKKTPISKVHGVEQKVIIGTHQYIVFPIYHPAFLLRREKFNQECIEKQETWDDLQRLQQLYQFKE